MKIFVSYDNENRAPERQKYWKDICRGIWKYKVEYAD